jgi:hypothetical protein
VTYDIVVLTFCIVASGILVTFDIGDLGFDIKGQYRIRCFPRRSFSNPRYRRSVPSISLYMDIEGLTFDIEG